MRGTQQDAKQMGDPFNAIADTNRATVLERAPAKLSASQEGRHM